MIQGGPSNCKGPYNKETGRSKEGDRGGIMEAEAGVICFEAGKKGAMSQGMHVASRSWKGKGNSPSQMDSPTCLEPPKTHFRLLASKP